MQKSINGATFRKMVMVANKILDSNQKYIDSLNVFPVPDGDTGKNMSMTFKSASTAVNECANNNFDTLGEALGKGALRGARGNSGVILSQILRGMSNEIILQTELTTKSFAKAMKNGAQMAYKAVTIPKEGTILTVIRVMADVAESSAKKHADFESFFEEVLNAGEQALAQTPELLPVLKAAGVVDAGGRGLLVIFTGLYKGLTSDEDFNFEIKPDDTAIQIQKNEEFHVNYQSLAEIQFGYCTEFMIIQMKPKTTESDIDKLREKLMQIGDCVICIGDLSLVKVHVHTNEPNRALGYALELGEIWNVKIDNMVQQNRELKEKQLKETQNTKPFGLVAVASGKGIADVFKDLGADEVIEGGQTMNPSADDIAKAVDRVPSEHVFVFPNNKNIILAAEQAQNLTKKFIHVIPSVSIPEGISGMLAFNSDGTVEENIEAMKASMENVSSGAVTYAVRKTSIDGLNVEKDDIIGLTDSKIVANGKDINDTTASLVETMISDDKVNITLFYGNDLKEEVANALKETLEKKYPDCEITVINGGQPVIYFILHTIYMQADLQ